MDEPEEPKSGDGLEQGARRSREEILREIKLALAIDGLGLDERRRQTRGFNPYDSHQSDRSPTVWTGRRRD